MAGYLIDHLGDSSACKAPRWGLFVLWSKRMNNTLSTQSTGVRWLVLAVVAILCTAALFYAYQPTPGRAFRKNVVTTQTNQGATDYKVTPDDLLW